MLATKPAKIVRTKDLAGRDNGWLMEIASTKDGWSRFLDNAQVYATSISPGTKKGFHLHHKKEIQVTCIKGSLALAVWDGEKITELAIGEDNPITVRVPKEYASAYYNFGPNEAIVINLCSPPYDPDDPEQEDLDLPWEPHR